MKSCSPVSLHPLQYPIMRSLSAAWVNHILSLLDSGHSLPQISSSTGHSTSTISKLHAKHRSSLAKSVGGRPSKLAPANIRHAIHLLRTGKAENAVQITKPLQDIINQPLSTKTVQQHLKEANLKPVVKRKRPFLSKRHRRERLDWAISHQDWTVEDWKVVVWSDETKINRLGSDGRKWVWKLPGETLNDRLVEGTLKFGGGSLMMWGCMAWEGVGNACKIDGKMDADLYVQILDEDLQESLQDFNKSPQDAIFQQDNDPKHKSKKATKWFSDNGIEVMSWPAQSADLSPIEHLWHHLKKTLKEYPQPPNGILELWECVQKEWDRIKPEVCQNLIESMPRRVAAVIRAKGGYTKY
jgi:transposase